MIGCLAGAAAYAGLIAAVLWAGARLRRYRERLPRTDEWDTLRAAH